jgi:hypothetical protein
MKKTLRFAALAAVLSLTCWHSYANASVLVIRGCDFKEGMLCRFVAPSEPCQWADGQAGACVCVNRDHYECVRF